MGMTECKGFWVSSIHGNILLSFMQSFVIVRNKEDDNDAGIFPWGSGGVHPGGEHFARLPATDFRPCFRPEPIPPNWVLSRKISNILLHFSLNFDYFLSQNYIRKLYAESTKFALILLWGHFGLSGQFFQVPPPPRLRCKSPPPNSIPESMSPFTKNFVKKPAMLLATLSWTINSDEVAGDIVQKHHNWDLEIKHNLYKKIMRKLHLCNKTHSKVFFY